LFRRWRAFSTAGGVTDGGLVGVIGGWAIDDLGAGTGLSMSGPGGGGGAVLELAAGRALAVGRVLAAGRVTRLGLRDLLWLTVGVGSPLVALLNTAVRSSHPRV